MERKFLTDWAMRPNICRCCLSTDTTEESETILLDGAKLIFSEVVFECFGFSLYEPQNERCTLICQLCMKSLNQALLLKKQVQECDRVIREYWEGKKKDAVSKEQDRKRKISIKRKRQEYTESKAQLLERDKRTNVTTVPQLSVEKATKCEPNGVKVKDEISTDKECNSEFNENRFSDEGIQSPVDTEQGKQIKKQLSERKKLLLSCEAILNLTSACPFRHQKSWFQCFYCTKEFMELNLLREHTFEKHKNVKTELKSLKRYPRTLQLDITGLKCTNCCENLDKIEDLERHLLEAHGKRIYKESIADYKINKSPYICHICNENFHVFRCLTKHLNVHYANCICNVCGKSFLNVKRLKIHEQTHEIGTFLCKHCGKTSKNRISLNNHIESAHFKRTLKCQICFETVKSYNHRVKHMSAEHGVTHMFKCHLCPKEYNIKHYLTTHLRQTHGSKNKKCTECGMMFITNYGLKKHLIKHSGERPFSCKICNKAYSRSSTLKEHMRTHDAAKF